MNDVINKLSGAKTYITAIGAICTAIVAYMNHQISTDQFIAAMFVAIQTMNIRHAITTSTQQPVVAPTVTTTSSQTTGATT